VIFFNHSGFFPTQFLAVFYRDFLLEGVDR